MLPAALADALIVGNHLGEINGAHNSVALCRHSDAVDTLDVEYRAVKGILEALLRADRRENSSADNVVLKLKRAVNPAVLGVIRDTTEVTDESVYRADKISLKVGLDEKRREGIINISVFLVNGNSLAVTFAEVSRENLIWKFSHNSIRN